MADGVITNPFGNLSESIAGLAQQRLSPQYAQTQLNFQEAIANQTRQNLANEFLSQADFSRDPAASLRTLGAILNNTDLIKSSLDIQLKQRAFEDQQRQLQQLAAFAEELAPGGLEPEEQARLFGRAQQLGVKLPSIPAGAKAEAPLSDTEKQLEQLKIKKAESEITQTQTQTQKTRREIEKIEKELSAPLDNKLAGLAASEETKLRVRAKVKAEHTLATIGSIKQDFDAVLDKFQSIPTSIRGPIAGRTLGIAAREIKGDPNVVAYEDFKQFILANISRQLGGERGVLTDKDVERIQKALPNLTDTNESAKQKIELMMQFIDRRVKEHQKIAGMEQVGIFSESGSSEIEKVETGRQTTEEIDEDEYLKENFPEYFQ